MNAHTIIEELENKGIKLEPNGENLRCKAPNRFGLPNSRKELDPPSMKSCPF